MIAVISDIHGNLPALEAVLSDIDTVGAQRIWCLGDTVGYGPYVNECVALVSERCEAVIAGNHDLAVRGDVSATMFGGSAGAGVQYARAVIDAHSTAFLHTLEPALVVDDVELYHGSSRDYVWEYVREPTVATLHLEMQNTDLALVGHSHAQLVFEMPDGTNDAHGGHVQEGTEIPLSVGVRRVANPGSVGQPRDRNPRAAWALIDGNRLVFRRVEYNIARMQAAVDAAGLPAEIGERLDHGL